MKFISLCSVIFLLFVHAAVAFEGDEHAFVSSNGLAIAKQHYLEDKNAVCREVSTACDELKKTITFFLKRNKVKKLKIDSTFYGMLAVFGDFQFDPYDYFKVWENFAGLPEDEKNKRFNQEYLKLLKEYDGSYRLFHASHNNTDHFQDQLMFSYWWWHKIAIEQASEGNLFSAILFNSFADHFLEDFFAPGHIQTPRDNMNDAYATAVHDFYNRKGSKFGVKQGQVLLPLLKSAQSMSANSFSNTVYSEKDYQGLQQVLETDGELYLYGDHSFSDARTDQQQLFMSIVIARSISDVLDSYLESRKANSYVLKNSFGRFYWTSRISDYSDSIYIKPATGKIRFGEYQPKRHIIPVYSTVYDLAVSHVSTLTKEEKEEQSATEIDLLFSLFGSYFYSLGNYSRGKDGKVNNRLRHKLFPFGGSIPVGFTYLTDDYTKAYKLKIEPMWHFSKYSAFVGAPLTYGKYEHQNLDLSENRMGAGIEVGMGFGMLHFVGGLTVDSLYAKQGGLDSMVFMKAGVRIIFPGSRLPWVSKVE